MVNFEAIKTLKELAAWVAERRLKVPDFEPDIKPPCIVLWAETEVNDWPDLEYSTLDSTELLRLQHNLQPSLTTSYGIAMAMKAEFGSPSERRAATRMLDANVTEQEVLAAASEYCVEQPDAIATQNAMRDLQRGI
jgi:hypothetical protein